MVSATWLKLVTDSKTSPVIKSAVSTSCWLLSDVSASTNFVSILSATLLIVEVKADFETVMVALSVCCADLSARVFSNTSSVAAASKISEIKLSSFKLISFEDVCAFDAIVVATALVAAFKAADPLAPTPSKADFVTVIAVRICCDLASKLTADAASVVSKGSKLVKSVFSANPSTVLISACVRSVSTRSVVPIVTTVDPVGADI